MQKRKTLAERLEDAKREEERATAQRTTLEAKKIQTERRRDTRRKILMGALAMEHRVKNPDSEFARVMTRLMDEYITREHDRQLFPELAPLPAQEGKKALS